MDTLYILENLRFFVVEPLSIPIIENYLTEIIIAFAGVIGIVLVYRKLRKEPKQPDYVKIFHSLSIDDEELNKPNTYDPKFIYHGSEKLGRIMTIDTQKYNYKPTEEEKGKAKDRSKLVDEFSTNLTTITFKKLWKGIVPIGETYIIHLASTEYRIDGKDLVIPQSVGLSAIGKHYVSKASAHKTGQIVDAAYHKRLLEANVNVMASRMSHIASESPEMAHELALKRLDIEKIRAEKETKMGGLI